MACLSTRAAAIGELIEDGVNGVLVPPADPAALAAALDRLIRAPELRARLGASGNQQVRARFSMTEGIDTLATRFGLAAAAQAAQ